MALPSKLYRFKIELSDPEKAAYLSLDFRIAQHPSESLQYLLTRVFAYALNFQPGIEFSPTGLSDPDSPCLRILNSHGGYDLWIEIGNPSNRKMHKASKAAAKLKIYTYKDPQVLMNELASEPVHGQKQIEIFSIPADFLNQLAEKIKKENQWSLICMDGTLMVNAEDLVAACELRRHQ